MKLQNFINGQFSPPASGAFFDDIGPATGDVIAQIPDSDARDVDAAVRAATAAFPGWSRTPVAVRSKLLIRLADLIEKNLEELARLESHDSGKTISLARRMDIPRAVANFRFFATAILLYACVAYLSYGVAVIYTLRQPYGVVGLFYY